MKTERYVVVGLFDAIDVGIVFSRSSWPAHVTIVSNFVTSASVETIVRAVRAGAEDVPMTIEFGGTDLFGPNRDIPVRLVRPGRISEVHRELAGALDVLADLRADEPSYWRDGYRPHLTLSPSVDAADGERRIIRDIAIARLDGGDATVVASLTTENA